MKTHDVKWREISDDSYLNHPECQIVIKHKDVYAIIYADEVGIEGDKIVANFGDCQILEVTHYAFID